jgi:outer membrane lipase/esterase
MSLIRNTGRRWRHALLCAVAVAGLAACGGGTSQREPFVPQRLISFGDEASVLVKDPARPGGARKYAVNVIVTTNGVDAIDCTQLPLWTQSVASVYGFVFDECNPGAVAAPQAATFARAGAKVADLGAQIDQARAAKGAFRGDDFVTMLMGTNDILEVYERGVGTASERAMADELRQRGEQLARVVNELVGLGPRVLLATVPDLGLSPYGRAQDAQGSGRGSALLSRLTAAFNEQLGVKIILDGSLIGLMQADQMVQSMARSPASFGLVNASDAICAATAVLPDCSTQTLLTDGNPGNYLWADGTRMSYGGHSYLGQLAQARALQNPF